MPNITYNALSYWLTYITYHIRHYLLTMRYLLYATLLSYMRYLQYMTLPTYSTSPNITYNALSYWLTYITYYIRHYLLTMRYLLCATSLSYLHYLPYMTLPTYSTSPNITYNALSYWLTYITYYIRHYLPTIRYLLCATLLSYMHYLQYLTLPSYSVFHYLICQEYDSSETLEALNI